MKTNNNPIEVLELSGLGEYGEDWARVYLEENNRYSDCGGRITVNIGDQYLGSCFFSHCGRENFKAFIGQCGYDYLIGKLFKTESYISMESGEEMIKFAFNNTQIKETIKEQRATGELTRKKLRDLYDNFAACEYGGPGRVAEDMVQAEFDTACQVFGCDWFYDGTFTKPNPLYAYHKSIIKAVIKACAPVSEVDAEAQH